MSGLNWPSKTGEKHKSAVARDSEIQALKAKLDAGELALKLAVTNAGNHRGFDHCCLVRKKMHRQARHIHPHGEDAA